MAIIIVAGIRLTESTKIISKNLGFGVIWGGALLLPLATSLPELVICWRSAVINAPDLAVGNVLGSNLFNLAIIAFIDIREGKKALFFKAKTDHILSASLGLVLVSFVSFSILNPLRVSIGWVGLDTVIILLIYLAGSLLISRNARRDCRLESIEVKEPEGRPPGILLTSILTFFMAGFLIVMGGINLTDTAQIIARETGLGQTFVGSLFLAASTSLPELVTTMTAVRMGMLDMALANIFGANAMNMLLVFFTDLFYRDGPLLSVVSQVNLVTVSFVIMLTSVAIFSLIYRSSRQVAGIGYDSLTIFAGYILAFVYLFFVSI